MIQADAADQELLVYLTHHWAGAPGLVLRHGGGHLEPRTTKALNLQRDEGEKNVMSVTFRPGSAQQTGPSRYQEPTLTKKFNSLISRKACPLLSCCFWVNTRPRQAERDLEQSSAAQKAADAGKTSMTVYFPLRLVSCQYKSYR